MTDIPGEWTSHEDWCCAKGCAGPGFCEGCAGTEDDCRCVVADFRRLAACVRADTANQIADDYDNYHGQLRVNLWLREQAKRWSP